MLRRHTAITDIFSLLFFNINNGVNGDPCGR
jgi:hypothetical protein